MKKRLTAWLLVFCMALSLLPGTAFAASGGGDGTVTITYDLNDSLSNYRLQLTTTPGDDPPANAPAAVWAGKPFLGWTSDPEGTQLPDYTKSTTLYAQWLSGYTVTLDFNGANGTDTPAYKTGEDGKLSTTQIAEIDRIIEDYEKSQHKAFGGWYIDGGTSGEWKNQFTPAITGNTIITSNNLKLYAKWDQIYTVTFHYRNGQTLDVPIDTAAGGKLLEQPSKPVYENQAYTFDAWYVVVTDDTVAGSVGAQEKDDWEPTDTTAPTTAKVLKIDPATYDFTRLESAGVSSFDVYANWTSPYGIIFDADGGQFKDGKDTKIVQTNKSDGRCAGPDEEPKKAGYKFAGWYTDTTKDDTKFTATQPFSEPATYYAKWDPCITIRVNPNNSLGTNVWTDIYADIVDLGGGTKGGTLDSKSQAALEAAIQTPSRANSTFLGWMIQVDGAAPVPSKTIFEAGDTNLSDVDDIWEKADRDPKNAMANISTKLQSQSTAVIIYVTAYWKEGYLATFDLGADDAKIDPALEKRYWSDKEGYLKALDADPTRPGYAFNGWFNKKTGRPIPVERDDVLGTPKYKFDEPTDVIAHWGPLTITLDANQGTLSGSTTVTVTNGKATPPANPTRLGYKFVNWSDKADDTGTTIDWNALTFTANTIVYAKWDNLTITLNPNGGNLTGDSTVTTNDGKATKPADPSRTGYTFDGWFDQADSTGKMIDWGAVLPFTTDTTVYAHWKPVTATGGGTGGGTSSGGTPTTTAASPSVPAAASAPNKVTATPASLAPRAGRHTITFDVNYPLDTGTPPAAPANQTTDADGHLASLPTAPAAPTGWTFKGWFQNDKAEAVTAGAAGTKFTDNTKLLAKWGAPFTITFDSNDGTGKIETKKTGENGKLDLNLPTQPSRAGYEFDGWYTKIQADPESPSASDKINDISTHKFDAPTTLYANWKLVGHLITFDYNYGTGSNTTTRRTAKDGTVEFPGATRPGYYLKGWYTLATGGSPIENSHIFTTATTLYAQWEPEITIKFHYNNGTDTVVSVSTKGGKWLKKDATDAGAGDINNVASTVEALLDTPVYGGNKFTGWFDRQEDGSGSNYAETNPSQLVGVTDLYAHWTPAEFTITFNYNGNGTNSTTQETVGGKVRLPKNPVWDGYLFVRWYYEIKDDDGNVTDKVTVTEDTIFSGPTTVKAEWKLFEEFEPADPDAPKVTFIVESPYAPDNAAHFVLHTNENGHLSHYPELVDRGGNKLPGINGWRRLNGAQKVTVAETYGEDTNLYINRSKIFNVTFDWCNGPTSDKETRRTDENGMIAEWPTEDEIASMNPGSHFEGWYTLQTGGDQVLSSNRFTSDTTIYAQWKSPHDITFDANGGKWADGDTQKVAETDIGGHLSKSKVPPDPSWEGYATFIGWGKTKDAGVDDKVEPATDQQPYEGPTTFYAIWGPPYKITYVEGENATMPELKPGQDMTKDDGTYPELPVPTHERDSFKGWYESEDFSGSPVVEGSQCGTKAPVFLYAKWEREPPYTITFDANKDTGDIKTSATMVHPDTGEEVTVLSLDTDSKGALMKAPPEPTLRGGKFLGWFTEKEDGAGEQVTDYATRLYTDETTLYAHWDTMEFKITFDFNLSSIGKDFSITTFTMTKGKTLAFLPGELPQAATETKMIEGWYMVPNPVAGRDEAVSTGKTFERDTTLYAKWVDAPNPPVVFVYPNVTFLDAEDGNALVTLEVDKDYKMAAVPPGPYKEGLKFSGWFYRVPDQPDGEERPFTDKTEVTGSMRVYPKYTGKGYTITFEPGEESDLEPIKLPTTAEGRIDGEIPTNLTWEGHTFSGWYTSAEGGTRINHRTVFTQDTTVYAHWDSSGGSDDPNNPDDPGNDKPGPTSPPYTITFNPNGGNLNSASTALTDLNGRLTSLPAPARTGYSFDGWYNGSERVTTATVFTANTTVTAQWGTGSGGSGSGDINGYSITVSSSTGGRVSVSTTYAREGDRVTVTVRPYSGYQLDRIDVLNARGRDVDLRDQGGNRYVFYMPASRVTVDAVFMELLANNGNNGNTGSSGNTGSTGGNNTGSNTGWNPGGTATNPSGGATSGLGVFSQPVMNTVPMPYLDVNPSDWYYSSVDYMWQRQLMGGVSSNRFGPQATTSNAMVWTILARLAGVDVTAGASVWYENARSWAVSNRISDGVGPNSPVTREQLATMLWNFKGSPAAGYDLGQFGDRGQISTYQAENALRWAVANNIVTGTGNRLNPRGTATRAEVAAMITRFCQNT